MNDQAKYTVTLEFETSGADAEINNLRTLQEAVDGVARAGGIGEQSQAKLSKALHNTGVAAGDASSGIRRSEESIISLRYANYDLASTLFATSAAITAVGAASLIAFASQESAFTEVERIAGGSLQEIQNLRDELQAMSTDIPVAFGELSNIASLGAALDIPADQLDEFTESVAKFAATTGVTVEAAATGFGKLAAYLQIPEEQFDALGSAILRAGNISVATEEQVLKFAQALALPGARIGFTTDQVVALGATLASFGNINVEGAGSALNRVTKNIERALAENGEDLQNWAAAAGMSAESFRVAWGSDVSNTFNQVIKGLSSNIPGLVQNLDALGIRNVRDQRIIEALALNYGKYNQILGETTSAWREGTYMNESYGLVLDDLASKFQIMLNAFSNFAAAVGAELAPAFGTLVDLVTQALVGLTDFINSPIGGTITRTVALLAGLAAGYAALRGVIALATASTYAFSFVSRGLGGAGILAGLRGLATAIMGVGSAGRHAAGGVLTLSGAIRGLLRATIIGGVLAYVAEWILAPGEAARWTADNLLGLLRTIEYVRERAGDVGATLLGFGNAAGGGAIADLSSFFSDVAANFPDANASLDTFDSSLVDLYDSLVDVEDQSLDTGGGISDLGDSAETAAQQVRTLVDYSNDLKQVWSRAFEIRFSGSQTLDAITSSFISIREAADEAAKRIRDLKNDISGLSSDISIQEYFLSIAIEYGDVQRAEAIEAELAKKRAELADKTSELQKQQDLASKSLEGNSKGAIENRKTISDLVQQYQAHIGALAASGMSQTQLAQVTESLRQDFIRQATQLGYSRAELYQYERAFDDVRTAINLVPRNITVSASTDPAQQAFNEMKAAMDRANGSVNTLRSNLGQGFRAPSFYVPVARYEAIQINSADRRLYQMGLDRGALQGYLQSTTFYRYLGTWAQGGYTGSGGKYEPAGIVHRGEYVIPKEGVNQATGLPYADALGRLMNGIPSHASGGPVGRSGGSAPLTSVSLTAGTIQALAQAVQPYLIVDGKQLGEVTSKAYTNESTVGAY